MTSDDRAYVREVNRRWDDAIRRHDVLVTVSHSGGKRWNVIIDTMTLPRWLKLSEGALSALASAVLDLPDHGDLDSTTIPGPSAHTGYAIVFTPFPTKNRAEQVRDLLDDAIHLTALEGDK